MGSYDCITLWLVVHSYYTKGKQESNIILVLSLIVKLKNPQLKKLCTFQPVSFVSAVE